MEWWGEDQNRLESEVSLTVYNEKAPIGVE